jgi:hypothetical protein
MAAKANDKALPVFSFSGHETFVFRYGWLKKAYDAARENAQVFGDDQAIVTLGVGKNMVRSIRHWALATGVLAEEPKTRGTHLGATPLADFLFGATGHDPYLEDPNTLSWPAIGHFPSPAGVRCCCAGARKTGSALR